MTQFSSKKTLATAIDLDADELRIADDKAKFIKGLTYTGGKNPNAINSEGDNQAVLTPFEGSEILSMFDLPAGQNYCVGTYECRETNELYVFVYNSSHNHCIYRVNGDKTIQLVYKGACLNFQYDTRYYITEGRCELRKQLYVDYDGSEKIRKFLLFTDEYNDQRFISVEDSIATGSFNPTTFPFFARPGYSCDPCYLINLGVATPMRCIGISNIERAESDKAKANLTFNKGFQFRIQFVDIFGRRSEHGIISDRYFTIIGSNCIATNNSVPRCYKLTIDAGCALTDKIHIEFRTTESGTWFRCDTIDKYNNCEDKPWYQRSINNTFPYNAADNTFEYVFCNDKKCEPIDEEETSRLYNPLPRKSSSISLLGKGIGLTQNLRGFEALDCAEQNKIDYQVVAPPDACDDGVVRTVIIYVPIVNQMELLQTGLWQYNIDNATIFWGQGSNKANPEFWGQNFVPGNYGFNGYFAGTQYVAMSKQVVLNLDTGQDYYYGIPKENKKINRVNFYKAKPELLCQKFELKVPPGIYSFRIASHLILQKDAYQASSTNVFGTVNMNDIFSPINDDKEIIVDCCNGDVILNKVTDNTLVIYDCTFGPYTCGHLYEDADNNIPLEYCNVVDETGGLSVFTSHTDFNGFYFGAGLRRYISLKLLIETCASSFAIQTRHTDQRYTNERRNAYGGNGDPYPPEGRRLVKGRVELCNSDIGVRGALIVSKKGPVTTTNSNGEFTLVLHQRPGGWGGDLIILSQSGGCRLVQCNDPCAYCFTVQTAAYLACGTVPREVVIPTWDVNIVGNSKGLKNGSRRSIGITMYDWMGRPSGIQTLEKHFVNIPSLIENKQFAFSSLTWTFANNIKFPNWVKYITFSITRDLNADQYLMWVADYVEYIDNGGVVNNAAPTKVRIYYASLNAYNKQNNYGTNTQWKINEVDPTGNTNSVIGDRVEFIKNGDGKWFEKTVTSLITYDKEGHYFDLEFTEDLRDIKTGALYYLVRPKTCETQHIYYELCSTVRVNNGVPEAYSGILNAFDAYFLNRQIPIPAETTNSKGETVQTLNATWFSFFFEHGSPSDFWGNGIGNRGRINVVNPFEREVWSPDTDLSKSMVDRSSFNGLNYFTGDIKEYDIQDRILVAMVESAAVLYITETDNFIVGFNDNTLRVSEAGDVLLPSASSQFGNPINKIGSDFGCDRKDINTIRKYKGLVFYLDSKRNTLVRHNYKDAEAVSILGYSYYLTAKIAAVNKYNIDLSREYDYIFIGGVDPQRDEYHLTVFGKPRSTAQPLYTNIELDHSIQLRESIAVSMAEGTLPHFPLAVPEYYGILEGYANGRSMFSFKTARAWSHRVPDRTKPYNNFFGVQGKKVLTVVTNMDAEKVKRFMATQVYCREHKMIADLITTESKQQSRIRSAWWRFVEKFWVASFLRDVNTFADPNLPILQSFPLTEGNPLSGRWLKIRYVSEDADDAKYCEISAVNTIVIPVEKTG